jgi:pyruvate/2-oxoglutarate dehydrogenase complex dihydrolipoamide acyltransferase (E2) component
MKTMKTSIDRKLSIYGFDAVNNGHNIYALLEFDITDLRKYLRDKRIDKCGGSLFSFFIKAIALCLKEYPAFNSMIDRKKTTFFDQVDVSIPIEIERDGKIENKQYIIWNASEKTTFLIDREIETAKKTIDDQRGFILSKPMQKLMELLPGKVAISVIRMMIRNHKRTKELSGTVFITSISMFSTIPGYIIPFIGGPKASSFAIGSISKKPIVIKDQIKIREMINVTVIFNHDIIDGAPAARFINKLRKMIENEYDTVG